MKRKDWSKLVKLFDPKKRNEDYCIGGTRKLLLVMLIECKNDLEDVKEIHYKQLNVTCCLCRCRESCILGEYFFRIRVKHNSVLIYSVWIEHKIGCIQICRCECSYRKRCRIEWFLSENIKGGLDRDSSFSRKANWWISMKYSCTCTTY